MYHHKTVLFGAFERHVIENPRSGCRFSVVPAYGACMLELVLAGKPVLDHYHTPEDLAAMSWSKGVLLFPFPNRLRGGTYSWKGETYHFPLNDKAGPNALHGFGRQKPLEVKAMAATETYGSLTCAYHYEGDDPAYPFPFTFEIEFTLTDPDAFEVHMTLRNDGTTEIPAGLGWHPYFQLSERIEELELQLPACHKVLVDGDLIPTGEKRPYTAFAQQAPIGRTALDNCFALDDTSGPAQILLSAPDGNLRYWQETGAGRFNYVQLFTPPHRNCIAIEPMTCNVDAFNNGEGLAVLAPGKSVGGSFGVVWQAKP